MVISRSVLIESYMKVSCLSWISHVNRARAEICSDEEKYLTEELYVRSKFLVKDVKYWGPFLKA